MPKPLITHKALYQGNIEFYVLSCFAQALDDIDGEEISETEVEDEFRPGEFERSLEAAQGKDFLDFVKNYNWDHNAPDYNDQYRPFPSNAFKGPLLLGVRCRGPSCAV